MRVLAIDTSMGRPGIALLEVATPKGKPAKPRIIDLSHVTTNASQHHGLRAEIIEAWCVSFIAKHYSKGFDVIVREDFVAKTSKTGHPVYSAWGACDRALNKFGLNFTTPAISQSAVKKAVFGKGKAEKEELAQAVREWTGYIGEFAVDDESDAAAIGLAYLINGGVITK
ncbi:crossover junction endodeoxyribonuclease RuvC [Peribacillus huizhouensis]|uniref:Crossover junction endodeoxyribonuclease RuvC n=1 Tax=Peribacillus huizhouensis TaxID=1501239 RepID=A0ABR6CR97_9BACI|nr:crossover junction endodeoxyribonuclease RuvC [Peribacillus huizhouensis]MBA9027558.1 crossover junction endodeoxyribonuclease RuvC [Peribacillus huizhouensis]